MPRLSRTVFAGIPHHITQRGNRRENIFFTDEDREAYLSWLKEYCEKFAVEILAYCLMTNHVHLVAVPSADDGLHRVLKPLHMRYAQRINRARGWKGHLWQGRYFSSPLDDAYLWAAVRYVERNPVRAGMERRAEDYRWSSAAAHCGRRSDALLNPESGWSKQFSAIEDWPAWLSEGDETEEIWTLRRNVEKGLPCGSEAFVRKLGRQAGRLLEYRPQGRPKRISDDE
ncbi:MAG TPA: transposase [Thiobacillaceae bacterium]|nr:transposase [Thiobacillaceae bacterium]